MTTQFHISKLYVPLPGKSHGQRSLVGCSPWGHEESDTTERLHFHFSFSCIGEGKGHPFQYSGLENSIDSIVHRVQTVGHDWATFTFFRPITFNVIISMLGYHLCYLSSPPPISLFSALFRIEYMCMCVSIISLIDLLAVIQNIHTTK